MNAHAWEIMHTPAPVSSATVEANIMKLSERHIRQLEDFLDRVRADTYPEPVTPMHAQIARRMFDEVRKVHTLPPRAKILDVGCGQGVALEWFTQLGFSPIGITINPIDLQVCRDKGFDVREMDQSFLDFEDNTFDLVWCRHCLEHSIFPYFTLFQVTRAIKPGGGLYVEVPAPDTSAAHQMNLNHYSTLVKSSWKSLISRCSIHPIYEVDLPLQVDTGPDLYWAFFGPKPADVQAGANGARKTG